MIRDTSLIKRFSSWYFDKKVLPYWAILLMDAAIVCVSSMFTYWVTNRTLVTVENRTALLLTSLLYGILSWVGARIFRTYLGVLRYSSTVDLAKLAYANLVAFGLAVASSLFFKQLGVEALCALSPLETMVVFLISTLLMWALRLLVKTIYEAGSADTKAMRVLIYGALTGGVGLAKYIRSQSPVKFELVGFISHEHRIKDKKLLGVPVYTVDDDIAAVVKRDKIEGVLVSPLRVDDFRQNQKIQNVLIEAGCKIFMAHDAYEASVKNGMIAYDDADGVQLREVSVEDLLPRQ